jgi:hypothetical protein
MTLLELRTTASGQLRVVGVSKNIENDDLASANVNFVIMINEHFLKTTTGI